MNSLGSSFGPTILMYVSCCLGRGTDELFAKLEVAPWACVRGDVGTAFLKQMFESGGSGDGVGDGGDGLVRGRLELNMQAIGDMVRRF